MFDALVIGGGPAGSTAALLLARAGWSVGVVEKASFPRRKVCGEFLSATNLPLLRHLGLAESFLDLAGPDVRRVGIFTRDRMIVANMPRLRDGVHGWGRALGREHLDTVLLAKAAAEGASVWQPWNLVACEKVDGHSSREHYRCNVLCATTRQLVELRARIVIAAHGSWEPGRLPTQPARRAARPSDLFGFKARFLDAQLPAGLMPLLAFPGGYGGMVHTDHGRVSLSCCVRRDQLDTCRRVAGASSAGEAVLRHMTASCSPLRDVLHGAVLEDGWRSAGPIRPGVPADSLRTLRKLLKILAPRAGFEPATLRLTALRSWRFPWTSAVPCLRHAQTRRFQPMSFRRSSGHCSVGFLIVEQQLQAPLRPVRWRT